MVCFDSAIELCGYGKISVTVSKNKVIMGHHALNWDSKMLMFVQIIMCSARLHSLIWEKRLKFK